MQPSELGPAEGPLDLPGNAGRVALSVLVVSRVLGNGDSTCAPLAELGRVAHGPAEEPADELAFFLINYLPTLAPESIAGFAAPPAGSPGDATLIEVDVTINRPELPRRSQRALPPISIPCVVTPADPQRVAALREEEVPGAPGDTARSSAVGRESRSGSAVEGRESRSGSAVEGRESRSGSAVEGREARSSAVDRWVHVLPLQHTLFVGARDNLEATLRAEVQRLVAAEERSAHAYLELLPARTTTLQRLDLEIEAPDRLAPGRAAGLRKALADRAQRREATAILRSVSTTLPERLRPATLVGRAEELKQLRALLGGKQRQGVLLSGREGCGKTALFLTWLAEVGDKQPVFCTSGAQLIAGMSGLGQWQERLRRVLDAAALLDAVLYFENLADLFGDNAESAVDLPGALRPYLAEGRVRLCGELCDSALTDGEARHVGFFNALTRLRVPDLSPARTAEALLDRAERERRRTDRRAVMLPPAIPVLIDLAERYLPYRALPGKAARLYDEILGVCEKMPLPASGAPQILIGAELCREVFSRHSGVPLLLLRQDQPLAIEDVVAALQRRLIGQAQAVRQVAETLCRVKAGLSREGRPLASFLFAGPTGVGKTELARALCAYLFAHTAQPEARLLRFDMSEFSGPDAADRLIRGSEREEGLLTRKVREQPFCVLLLDEIEKAHPQVFDLLLQVLGDGRLTDGRGRTTTFHNAIVILTSNLGAGGPQARAGFAGRGDAQDEHFLREVRRAFRPEFIGRLDRIIPFAPLLPEEVARVARLQVARIADRRGLRDLAITLEVSEAALLHLATRGYAAAYGARQLRRCLEDELVAPLARALAALGQAARRARAVVRLAGEAPPRDSPLSQREAGELRLWLLPPLGGALRGARLRSSADLSALRRLAEGLLSLERVQEVRDRAALLAAQLNQQSRRRGAAVDLAVMGALAAARGEHERLRRLWDQAEADLEALREIEELAVVAALSGEAEGGLALMDDARARHEALRDTSLRLLVAMEPQRDQAALLIQELDGGRALDLWLGPLLAAAAAWGWQLTLHVDGDSGEGWEPKRRLGPPRGAEEGWRLLSESRRQRALLLVVRGTDAGVLLALEAGRQRWLVPGTEPCEVHLALCALRGDFSDEEWLGPALTPQALGQRAGGLSLSRTVDLTRGEVTIASVREPKVTLAGRGYWGAFREIALTQLLLCEEPFGAALSREALLHARLPERPAPPARTR